MIDPSLIDPSRKKKFSKDLIKAACNDARNKADQKTAEETLKGYGRYGFTARYARQWRLAVLGFVLEMTGRVT